MFHTLNNTIVRFHTNSHQRANPGGGLLGLNPHMEKRAGVECPSLKLTIIIPKVFLLQVGNIGKL